MVLAESKNKVGLGRALMNSRSGSAHKTNKHRGTGGGRGGRGTGAGQSEILYTTEKHEADWYKMRSITQQNDLDEFLTTAELADTDFTAEKTNSMKIIHKDQVNSYLLTPEEEHAAKQKHKQNVGQLTVPRRPPWDSSTTPAELERREKDSFLYWRRGLAELQETKDILMTPFERNLEVWRQLWRVIERSDLVVQIVDARNPLLFRSEDLGKYVKEVDKRKNNLLLVNKADMMTAKQRVAWADYFEREGISYRFFSAAFAKLTNEEREGGEEQEGSASEDIAGGVEGETRTKILTTDELEGVFLEHAPDVEDDDLEGPRRTQIGLVGYPNVGKSSTINALIGAKKVSVSSTPGKTKHFQTLHLSDRITLCDCPGLVFPNFATTKADLVCNGVLPIDQLREFTGPATLVSQRIPQQFLESLYGIKILTRPPEEGGTGIPTGEELLVAYATARGFYKTGAGNPDESRAARYVLKDYVNGRLLFCHPPPTDPPVDPHRFNQGLYDEAHLPKHRRAGVVLPSDDRDDEGSVSGDLPIAEMGEKSHALDKKFFGEGGGSRGHLKMPFHQGAGAGGALPGGRNLTGRKARTMIALDNNLTPEEVKKAMGGKKHFKGKKSLGKKILGT